MSKKKITLEKNEKDQKINKTKQTPSTTVKNTSEFPISDDTLDMLESEADKLSESKNLSEKIQLHHKLKESIERIGTEIDGMAELIDNIDLDAITDELSQDNDDTEVTNKENVTDVADDIVNLEKELIDLKEEEILQEKIKQLKLLIRKVKKCKAKCDPSEMRIHTIP